MRDVENFRQQMFSMDVCFSSSNPHASRDSVNSQEIREGLPEGKRPEGKTLKNVETFLEDIPSSICCSMFTFFPNRDQQMRSDARKPRCRPSATNQVATWHGNWTDMCNIIVTAILYFFLLWG